MTRRHLLLLSLALLGPIVLVVANPFAWGHRDEETRTPGPAEETCDTPTEAIAGSRPAHRWTDLEEGASIDATGAVWSGADDWPVHVEGGAGLCWRGGEIVGTFADDVSWDDLHGTGAFNLFVPGATVSDLRIHNYGDGIRVLDDAHDFRILDVHLSFVRDDCIENDDVRGGLVRSALLDGCYVAFSARPWQDDFAGDGSDRTWRIEDSLVRLEPMPTVYRGRAPGHGGFFKWDEHGRSPALVLRGNVFRADQDSNHTSMGIPAGTTCADNIMVWLGDGPYPEPLPDCFEITTDPTVWDEAVANWRASR